MRQDRRYLLAVPVLFFVCALVVSAVDYSVSFTAKEAKYIHKLLEAENADRVSQGLSPVSTSTFVNAMAKNLFRKNWRKYRRRLLRSKTNDQLDNFVGVN